MSVLMRAAEMWKKERGQKSSMRRRLILFFSLSVVCVILTFTLLLMVFGITGSGRQTVYRYLESELKHISGMANDDLGHLSVTGVSLAQRISDDCEDFFRENGIEGKDLAAHPELLEPLLAAQMQTALSAARNNTCGGVFILLDATVAPDAEDAAARKAGLFIKKTQPASSESLSAKTYFLRGPANIAREHGVELLGQWKMEYDVTGQDFFLSVMETARENPGLSLSRLYYWSDRVRLKGNSEEGFLLCVPLRLSDGTVFGLCGIEVSDRMFKQSYSPDKSAYRSIFTVAAPSDGGAIYAQRGMIAGNSYLTGLQMASSLTSAGAEKGFPYYRSEDGTYSGLTKQLNIYPHDSPYAGEGWTVAVLIPQSVMDGAIRGSSSYLFFIIAGLLIASIAACVLLSRQFMRPIEHGLSILRETMSEPESAGSVESGIAEIDSLLEDFARERRTQQEELQRLVREKQDAQEQYEKAQTQIERLSDSRKSEIDPDSFARFLENLKKLTPTERRIFDLYFQGKQSKEIMELTGIKENTLKYHNRNIYGKLGINSRKQLLCYAELLEQRAKEGAGAT